MGIFFSKSSSSRRPRITSQDRAILELKVQRDKLKQYQKRIQIVLNREAEIAKEHVKSGQKQKALLVLKKKKYQEGLLEKTDQQLFNLEQLTQSIEYALVEQKVFAGLQEGNKVLAQIQKEMSLEDVEKLMQDTADAIYYQNEVSRMLGGEFSAEDEAGLLEELGKLQAEHMENVLPSVPVSAVAEPPLVSVKETSAASLLDAERSLSKVESEDEDQREAISILLPM